MKNTTKGAIIKGSALVLDVAAPFAATLSQFPFWVEKSSAATVSGLFILLCFMSAIPFLKQIREWLKSPSAWSLWCVLSVMFIAINHIIEQMVIICCIGALANLAGAGLHAIGCMIAEKPDKELIEEGEDKA